MNIWHPGQLKKLKSWGPIYQEIGQNGLNWQCCLAGSSKTAPRILIFSIAMGADYSFKLIFIVHWVPQFIGHNKIFLCSVMCLLPGLLFPMSKDPLLYGSLPRKLTRFPHHQHSLPWLPLKLHPGLRCLEKKVLEIYIF